MIIKTDRFWRVPTFLFATLVVVWFGAWLGALIAGYTWGRGDARSWSHHSFGPLSCIGYGTSLQCAVREEESVERDTFALLPVDAVEDVQHEQRMACIALAVFSEASGEPELGLAAVARTVVNRMRGTTMTECDVVTTVAQYQGIERLHADPWLIDAKEWDRALSVSTRVAADDYDVGQCRDAVSFYSGEDIPDWAPAMKEVCRIGGHRFFAEG